MRSFIESYRKPLLAVFGVVLMIVFTLPSNLKTGSGERNNQVIGHIGKEAVHAQDNATAEQDWEIITRHVVLPTNNPRQPFVPVALALLPDQSVANYINAHRQAYFLLIKEAEMQGVTLVPAEVNSLLEAAAVHDRDRVVAFSDLPDQDVADRYKAAVERLLMVRTAFSNAASVIKVSEPMRRQLIAQRFQTVNMAVVDVPAASNTTEAPGLAAFTCSVMPATGLTWSVGLPE